MAGLGAYTSALGSFDSLQQADQKAHDLQAMQKVEHLSLKMGKDSLLVVNDGVIPSDLAYMHLTFPSGSTDRKLERQLPVGSSFSIPLTNASSAAIVTTLGNVFAPPLGPLFGGEQFTITFDRTGVPPSDGSVKILTVDSTAYNSSELPLTFSWGQGDVQSYSYSPSISSGFGTRLGWSDSRGLWVSREASVTVIRSGQIVGDYLAQYLLSFVGGGNIRTNPSSPTGDRWFDAGTTVYVTTDFSWNKVSGQSRQNLVSWNTDNSSPVVVQRSGTGAFTTTGITMNAPHAVGFDSVTQFSVTESSSLPSSGSVAGLQVLYRYNSSSSTVPQALANAGFESGVLGPWIPYPNNNCGYPYGIVADPVHTGSFALYTNGQFQTYGCHWPVVEYDAIIGNGLTLTSVNVSIWTKSASGNGGQQLEMYVQDTNCDKLVSAAPGIDWEKLTISCSGSLRNSPQISLYLGLGNPVYWDDAVLTYTYYSSPTGTIPSGSSYSVKGDTVSYSYPFSYSFPTGSSNNQLRVTYPATEDHVSLNSGQCGSSRTSFLDNNLTIMNACSSTYVLNTAASGSYSSSIGPSVTQDSWYDAGSVTSLSAFSTGPFAFAGWVNFASGGIGDPSKSQTKFTVNGPTKISAEFRVIP